MAITKKRGWGYKVCTADGTNNYDELSMYTDASDVYTKVSAGTDSVSIANTNVPLHQQLNYAPGTLASGSTVCEINNSLITADGMLDIYVPVDSAHPNDCKLVPTAIEQRDSYVKLTFPAQDHSVAIRVRCWK